MEIFSNIVGTHFRPSEAKAVANALAIGESVQLVAESENPYDPMAVAVYASDEHIGYIARANNYQVSEHLQSGGEVSAKVVDRDGKYWVLLIEWNELDTLGGHPHDD
jgi:hypothetical protein